MPIIRKLTVVGASRGITLPKSWIEEAEHTHGQKIKVITMEINDIITIRPVFESKEKVREANAPSSKSYPKPLREALYCQRKP